MDCFAKQTAQKYTLTVLFTQAIEQITIQIDTGIAIYQAAFRKDNIPRLFESLHLNTVSQIYQKLKHSQKQQGMDFVFYLDQQKQQIGVKVSVQLLSTGQLIEKKLLLQTNKFLRAQNNLESELREVVRSIVNEQLNSKNLVERKELGQVAEKVDIIDFDLQLFKEQLKSLRQKTETLSSQKQ